MNISLAGRPGREAVEDTVQALRQAQGERYVEFECRFSGPTHLQIIDSKQKQKPKPR